MGRDHPSVSQSPARPPPTHSCEEVDVTFVFFFLPPTITCHNEAAAGEAILGNWRRASVMGSQVQDSAGGGGSGGEYGGGSARPDWLQLNKQSSTAVSAVRWLWGRCVYVCLGWGILQIKFATYILTRSSTVQLNACRTQSFSHSVLLKIFFPPSHVLYLRDVWPGRDPLSMGGEKGERGG